MDQAVGFHFRALNPWERILFEDYAAYRLSFEDSEFAPDRAELSYDGFQQRIEAGSLVPCHADDGVMRAWFGIELCQDDERGGYLSVLYFAGHFSREMIWPLVRYLRQLGRLYRQGRHEPGCGRCYVRGRKGWRRLFERAGVVFDGEWIDGDQEVNHGRTGRISIQ